MAAKCGLSGRMRRQITNDELADFYRRIGAALWYLQHLESALVNFLSVRIIHERRCAGQEIGASEADSLIVDKRKITLGPLIDTCRSRKVIKSEYGARFETLKTERHWLVHRSLVESGDDLYHNATRAAVFGRIAAVEEEACSLMDIISKDLASWLSAQGVDLEAAQNEAEDAIRKLKGG
jgi:hypothetical protein